MGDVTLQELLDEFDDESMEDKIKKYVTIERQVATALVEGIDPDADAHMVQSILLTKLIGVAMSMGMPERKFMSIVSNTWQTIARHTEPDDGVIH